VKHFIAATNENNEVPDFLRTGVYTPISPSKNCISSAMNVGHPSNLARIVALYGGVMDETGIITGAPDIMAMRKDLSGIFVSDDETRGVIADVFRKFNILLEPHGAVAWHAINSYQGQVVKPASDKQLYISLETAHPAKFPQEIKNILNFEPKLPRSMNGLLEKEEYYLSICNSYPELKEIIVKNSIPK
jgi:threonine synthase